jgi:hypothetical protein
MHPRLFLAVLPALLCAALPALAIPIQSSDSLSVEARSLDFSTDAAVLASRDVAEDYLVERDYDYEDLLSRDFDGDLFPRVVRPKTAKDHASEARKASVKTTVAHNQAANAAKKTHLQGEAAKLPEYVDLTPYFFLASSTILIRDTGAAATESLASPNTPKKRRRRVHSTSPAAIVRKAARRAVACPSSPRHPRPTSLKAST